MKLLQKRKYMAHYILAILLILAFFYSYAAASVTYYPTNEWQISAPEAQGMHTKPILHGCGIIAIR